MMSTGWLANKMGVHRDTVLEWASSGRIPSVRIGRSWLIPLSEFRNRYAPVWDSIVEKCRMVGIDLYDK
jgi:excisionase family DNA binding protein